MQQDHAEGYRKYQIPEPGFDSEQTGNGEFVFASDEKNRSSKKKETDRHAENIGQQVDPELESAVQKVADGIQGDMVVFGSGQDRSQKTAPEYQVSEQRINPRKPTCGATASRRR